jgi:Predicted nucleotidyltransferases
MTRDDILATIAERRRELAALDVRELALFGSFAREDQHSGSDLDFIVRFGEKSFDRYMALKELLESLFGRKVDLVLESALKPRLRERILKEAVRAA